MSDLTVSIQLTQDEIETIKSELYLLYETLEDRLEENEASIQDIADLELLMGKLDKGLNQFD